MLRNKLRAMLSAKPIYQRLAYLESTGKQLIVTSMQTSNNLTVYMDFALLQTVYDNSNRWCCSHIAENHKYRPLRIEKDVFQIYSMGVGNGSVLVNKMAADTERHTILYNDDNGDVLWDGVNKGNVFQEIPLTDHMELGVFGQSWGLATAIDYSRDSFVKMRLYELIGYDKTSGEKIYHAIPVLDNNGVACLYDKVGKRFEYDMLGQEVFNYAI